MYSNLDYVELTNQDKKNVDDKDKDLLENEQIGNSQSGKKPYFKVNKKTQKN